MSPRIPRPRKAETWRRLWEHQEEWAIFLLWVRKESRNGLENVDLRAVDTSRAKIELHAEMVKRDEPDAVGIWIEERVANHLYGQRDVRLAFRLLNLREEGQVWMRDES